MAHSFKTGNGKCLRVSLWGVVRHVVVVLRCWACAIHRRVKGTPAIRPNRAYERAERTANEVRGESSRLPVSLSASLSHKEGLQRDLKSGNGIERMLFECRFEMSESEFRRLLRRDLGWFAYGAECGADRALGLVESFPDTVRCGITQSAFEALKSLPPITGEDSLSEKLPQAIGIQKESFDLVGGPHAEGSTAAGGSIPITAEDTPSTDGFPTQLRLVIATQKAVANQESKSFTMGTSHRFQHGEYSIDFVLRATNPLTHDSAPPSDTSHETRSIIPYKQDQKITPTIECNPRRGMISLTKEAGCEVLKLAKLTV